MSRVAFGRWVLICAIVAPAASLSLALAGCGTREGLVEASGKVTLDGQPLADALVEFIPQGATGVVSMGRTDRDGNYYMMASRTAKGASVGVNKVRITTYEILDLQGKQQMVPERVPTKYNSETVLSVTVAETGMNQFNFDLSTTGAKIDSVPESPLVIQ
jgi:hypothetical protein